MTNKQEPPYIKLYMRDVSYMRDMPNGLMKVVYSLTRYANVTDQGLQILLPSGLKNKLSEELGINRKSFNNALTKLCKGKIIRRIDTGVYELNPYLFGKGEWKDIEKIRATWEYDAIKGRTYQGTIIRKDGTVETMGEGPEINY